MLKKLNLKFTYNTEDHNLLRDFYIPVLSNSIQYDRAVGYFSAAILKEMANGLDKFIMSNGKMRLIIGEPLSPDEYQAVIEGKTKTVFKLEEDIIHLLTSDRSTAITILTYLIATKRLEIKIALRKQGMFHQKIGIACDINNNTVVFQGSANETIYALREDLNSEQISVYPSWTTAYDTHGKDFKLSYEKLWNNQRQNTIVIDITSHSYQKIVEKFDLITLRQRIFSEGIEIMTKENDIPIFVYDFPKGIHDLKCEKSEILYSNYTPKFPELTGTHSFQLYSHQNKAIKEWFNNNGIGLLKLATGSGKTITAISIICELYIKNKSKGLQTVVIIAIPYIELAEQWIKELNKFNIEAIKCYHSKHNWYDSVIRKSQLLKTKQIDFCCLVVVNATLRKNDFFNAIKHINPDKLLFIGDECHHLGSDNLFLSLPNAKYRLGLSATPFKTENDEIETPFPDTFKKNILCYFDKIIADYNLKNAIDDGILSPYEYTLVPIYLTYEEQERYDQLSESIRNYTVKAQKKILTVEEKQILTTLCGHRTRLIATSKNKIIALDNLLKSEAIKSVLKYTIVYVGEGFGIDCDVKYIDQVSNVLFVNGIRSSRFTSNENTEKRKSIMRNFADQSIDALVAMKVLDEGIDVPICETAIIMASTRNPRQYIQRRGRVLRRADGKNLARIFDFITLPSPDIKSEYGKKLFSAELERVNDFKETALNSKEVDDMIKEFFNE